MSFKILSSSIYHQGETSVNIYNLFEGIIYYDQSKMSNESGITKNQINILTNQDCRKKIFPYLFLKQNLKQFVCDYDVIKKKKQYWENLNQKTIQRIINILA